jgi:hypothetical protein
LPNRIGLRTAAPLFNDAAQTGALPGSVVSTSRDASYVSCATCHADFGGHDGRTWDFSQFGRALRNTMDLRPRRLRARHLQQRSHAGVLLRRRLRRRQLLQGRSGHGPAQRSRA